MLIIATFSQVGTLSRSGHIKIVHPWRINMYILPLFMDEVLREEIVKKDNEIGGNIPGGNFPGGGGGIFQGGVWWVGILPGGIFLEPIILLDHVLYSWYMLLFLNSEFH